MEFDNRILAQERCDEINRAYKIGSINIGLASWKPKELPAAEVIEKNGKYYVPFYEGFWKGENLI